MARAVRPLFPANVLAGGFEDALTAALAQLAQPGETDSSSLISAVSGGPDSMVLACLARDYAARNGMTHSALVVDHGIRSDSAVEAARVAARLQAFGISAEILTIAETAPATGIQEWARTQRYTRLLARARDRRACLLLGHHAADQAETVMMRLHRGSGLAGLAGMRRVTIRDGVPILRPLLHADHATIRDYCDRHGLAFEIDPSNADSRFERVRCRRMLAVMDEAGLAVSANLRRLSAMAGAIDDALIGAMQRQGLLEGPGAAGQLTMPDRVLALPPLVLSRLLAQAIRLVASPGHGPGQDALRRLCGRLAEGRASTLGGARFTPISGGWLVTAEIGRHPPRLQVAAGDRVLFAGNWIVRSRVQATIRHLGVAGSGAAASWRDSAGWSGLLPLVRRSLPVLETLDGTLLYPHLISHGTDVRADVAATAEYLRQTGIPLSGSS